MKTFEFSLYTGQGAYRRVVGQGQNELEAAMAATQGLEANYKRPDGGSRGTFTPQSALHRTRFLGDKDGIEVVGTVKGVFFRADDPVQPTTKALVDCKEITA